MFDNIFIDKFNNQTNIYVNERFDIFRKSVMGYMLMEEFKNLKDEILSDFYEDNKLYEKVFNDFIESDKKIISLKVLNNTLNINVVEVFLRTILEYKEKNPVEVDYGIFQDIYEETKIQFTK